MNGEFKNWSIRNDQADRLRPLRRKAFINLGKYWVETFTDKNGEADFRLVKAKSNRNEKGGSK